MGERLTRLRPRHFFALTLAAVGVLFLPWILPTDSLLERFIEDWFWRPIVADEGYNVVSTALLLVLSMIAMGWFSSLFRIHRERLDLELVIAFLPAYVWGSTLRILEDSDLFAPFRSDVARWDASLPSSSPCVPHAPAPFLERCLGVFFVTPFLWIGAALVLLLFIHASLWVEAVARRQGVRLGVLAYLLTFAGAFLVFLGLWVYGSHLVRHVAPPWVPLVGILAAMVQAGHQTLRGGGLTARRVGLGYSYPLLALAVYYVAVALRGGAGEWDVDGPFRPWVLLAFALAPSVLVVAFILVRPRAGPTKARPRPVLAAAAWLYGATLMALVIFLGLQWREAPSGVSGLASFVAGGLAIGVWMAVLVPLWDHWPLPALRRIAADPFNQIMLWSQGGDAFLTGLSIDTFGLGEKHVLPTALIAWVDRWALPGVLGTHPATIAMALYKVPLTLGLMLILDLVVRPQGGQLLNVVRIMKLAVVGVGLGPGLRDALRLALGV